MTVPTSASDTRLNSPKHQPLIQQSHGNQRDLNRWGRAAFVRESPLGGRLLKPDDDSHVNHERSEEAGSSLTAQSSVAFHRQNSGAQEYLLIYEFKGNMAYGIL
ncbi:unnamed protein product [Leuciscus chuanchicus]